MEFARKLLDQLGRYEEALGWIVAASLLLLIATPAIVSWVVLRLPVDYFIAEISTTSLWRRRHPAIGVPLLVAKNLVGIVLILAGVAMLMMPGQGILTILVGLGLVDFPGRHRLLRYLGTRPSIWRTLAWLRRRAGKPSLKHPGD